MGAREHGGSELLAGAAPQPIAALGLDEPATARSSEKYFLEHGLNQQAEQRLRSLRKPNQGAPERRARDKRSRAVDGVDEPGVLASPGALALLLGDDAVV